MDTRRWFVFVLALWLGLPAAAAAQEHYAFGFSPRSGDAWVDARLGDMNVFARGDLDGFVDEVVVSFGAPRYLVREYVVDRRWAPGDVYYACAIAHYTRRPCIEVIRIWETDHGHGWGVVAQRLGIKPGSPEFHALKGRVGKSHGRWQGAPPHGHGGPPAKAAGPGRGHVGGPPAHAGDKGQGKGKGKGRD